MNNLTININENEGTDASSYANKRFTGLFNILDYIIICFPDPDRNPWEYRANQIGQNDQIDENAKMDELEFIHYMSDELLPQVSKRKSAEGIHQDLEKVYAAYPKMKEVVGGVIDENGGAGGSNSMLLCWIIVGLLVAFLAGLIVGYRAGKKRKRKK